MWWFGSSETKCCFIKTNNWETNVDPLWSRLGEQIVAPSELKLGEQNVVPSKLKLGEKNVVSSKLKNDESSNLCGLKLIMVTVYNSNDEITCNTN